MSFDQTFTASISNEAWAQIDAQVRNIAVEKRAPMNAARWLERLLEAIDSLEANSLRCPIDHKQTAAQGRTVRKMVFDRTYLLRYVVDEEARRATIVSFRHGARWEPS